MSSSTEKRKKWAEMADKNIATQQRHHHLDYKFMPPRKLPLSSVPSNTKYGTFGGRRRTRRNKRKTHRRKR